MKIASMFGTGRTVFSFEVFPPKRTTPIESIYRTLEQLDGLHPDFISVTYGAGGNTGKHSTLDIAAAIKERYGTEPLMHLTCLYNTKEDINDILAQAKARGIENVMALRGDKVPDLPPQDDFHFASELTEYINSVDGFDIGGACYPEGHPSSESMVADILNLRKKVEAGCTHLISQLFFDNELFYAFLEKARIAGINVPIEAGIMPVTNKSQIEKMVTLCGASLPGKFTRMMQRYEDHPEALIDAGIAYAVDQIVDLISQGVDGIHLYTMNNPQVARRISESVGSLLQVSD